MGADTKASTGADGGPERGHSALLQHLAQLDDALSGVGALAMVVDAAELIGSKAAGTNKR